jgi:hypothetical protein
VVWKWIGKALPAKKRQLCKTDNNIWRYRRRIGVARRHGGMACLTLSDQGRSLAARLEQRAYADPRGERLSPQGGVVREPMRVVDPLEELVRILREGR